MSEFSNEPTNAFIPAGKAQPSHQLASRPFVVQSPVVQRQSDEGGDSRDVQAQRLRQLDAGMMQTLSLQAKLAIDAPGDKYEQEADQGAAHAVEKIGALPTQSKTVQCQDMPKAEDKELQMKSLIQRQLESNGVTSEVQGENRTGMPDTLKNGLEGLSGMDLSSVKVHRNSSKPAQVKSLAYAEGQDIYLGPGQEHHLPHEGWHAVQQMQGRVRPTVYAEGIPVNDDESLEKEADVMGMKANQQGHQFADQGNAFENRNNLHLVSSVEALQQQQSSVVQKAPPLVFAGLSAEAWALAGTVVSTVTTVGGVAAAGYSAVTPGENRFGSLALPQNRISGADQRKLQQVVRYRIINEYVRRYLERNPNVRDQLDSQSSGDSATGGSTPGNTPAPTSAPTPGDAAGDTPAPTSAPIPGDAAGDAPAPTGAPTASGIDQQVLDGVKNSIEIEIETALQTDPQAFDAEFMWGEDNTTGTYESVDQSRSGERVGVTGFLQFHNLRASVLKETLSLSSDAQTAVGALPDEGTEVVVHKFIGGSVGGRCTWSAWQNLAVNIDGGAAVESYHDNGSVQFTIRTTWYWDRWGPNSESHMENEIYIGDNGLVTITVNREDSP